MFLRRQSLPARLRFNSTVLRLVALPFCALGLAINAQAATRCVNPAGAGGCYKTIGLAVAAAASGDVINVSPGTYKEQVTIAKSLSLISTVKSGAVINATGLSNGIFVNGMSAAPNTGVANVVISGFTVHYANFEGILVANATKVTLVDNLVTHNNLSLDINTPACPNIPAFETNEAEDCGEGIHLMAVNLSSIVRNEVSWNSGGILISDETGPNHDNMVSNNFVHNNSYDCGITLASHGPATSVIPSATLPYGIMRNTIWKNRSWNNGTQVPGAGAGVGIFAPFPGTINTENVVIENDLENNGLPGVTMHNHAWSQFAPPVNMNNNVIIDNYLSGNGADTADAATGGPTGINIYSVGPVTGTIVQQNSFAEETFDLVFNAPSGQVAARLNDFDEGVGVANLGKGTIMAMENWWDCASGPGTGNCASVQGTGVTTSPWLPVSFGPADPDDY